ncbi:MAG: SRPBCC family protein [Bacteroidia bacterium]|nr:SRPBCC family protein [Bacteroidia bacterium]
MIILYILLALIAILLISAALMNKNMSIRKTISINKPAAEVYNYLKLTKNQDNFSVWNMADPNMKKDYMGTDGTVGFKYSWDSTNKNVGAGEQEIKSLSENKSIDYEIRFTRPMKNVANGGFVLESKSPNETSVSWCFNGPMIFPMNLMKSMFEKMLGKDLESGLNNLKGILEK